MPQAGFRQDQDVKLRSAASRTGLPAQAGKGSSRCGGGACRSGTVRVVPTQDPGPEAGIAGCRTAGTIGRAVKGAGYCRDVSRPSCMIAGIQTACLRLRRASLSSSS